MFLQSMAHLYFMSKFVRASLAAFAFFVLVSAAQTVGAATITVTNTADSGAGSLRQAVSDANATTAADTINFNIPLTDSNCNSSGVCTITLAGGAVTAQAAGGNLTIANQIGASKLVISGSGTSSVFQAGQDSNLTIDGLTVTRGGTGVISNQRGKLTIMNSIVTGNSGGNIIYSLAPGPDGVLNIINTTVKNNTGIGVYSTNNFSVGGALNIINSTISNNISSGTSGGGIFFTGDRLQIANSTVSGNSGGQGGGMFLSTVGTSSGKSFVLTNCTVTANSATDSLGGGGIHLFQITIELRNTIVAGNTSSSGTPDFYFQSAGANSLGNNLIGNSTNTGSPNGVWIPGDTLNQNARLAPLADNGGPTQTHALLSNSPAIDAGNNCVLTANGCGNNNPALPTDQRGKFRPGIVDIGAFELITRSPLFDFDGDGKADISVFRPSDGTWYRINSSNNSFYAAQFGAANDFIAPADYDGDGKTDLAVWRIPPPQPGGGQGNPYFYILNSADNTFRPEQFGSSIDQLVVGDWDGDRKADLAVYRYNVNAQSNFYYRPSSDPSISYNTIVLGGPNATPVVGDFDGDGRNDAAVREGAVWRVMRSSDNQISSTTFGLSTDTPVPADFDGDGKTDIAVFRSSTGYWYTSTNPDTNYGAIQFGANGDLPVPADYDGDGKADVAVYRGGAWYMQRSTSGFLGVQFGTAGDKPVRMLIFVKFLTT